MLIDMEVSLKLTPSDYFFISVRTVVTLDKEVVYHEETNFSLVCFQKHFLKLLNISFIIPLKVYILSSTDIYNFASTFNVFIL